MPWSFHASGLKKDVVQQLLAATQIPTALRNAIVQPIELTGGNALGNGANGSDSIFVDCSGEGPVTFLCNIWEFNSGSGIPPT
jgi:hypothetical protein